MIVHVYREDCSGEGVLTTMGHFDVDIAGVRMLRVFVSHEDGAKAAHWYTSLPEGGDVNSLQGDALSFDDAVRNAQSAVMSALRGAAVDVGEPIETIWDKR